MIIAHANKGPPSSYGIGSILFPPSPITRTKRGRRTPWRNKTSVGGRRGICQEYFDLFSCSQVLFFEANLANDSSAHFSN